MSWTKKTYKLKYPIEQDGEKITSLTVFNKMNRVGTMRKAAKEAGKDPSELVLLIAMLAQCIDVDQEVFDEMHQEDMTGLTELINDSQEDGEGGKD
jgi:hypothetical protein